MKVQILKEKTAVIDRITSKSWPSGWVGHIADEVLSAWVDGTDYRPVAEEAVEPGVIPAAVMTPLQVAVLTAAADQAIAAAGSADAGPEVTVVPNPDEQPIDLNALSINDLRAAARQIGIKGAQTMSKAALVEALEARRA